MMWCTVYVEGVPLSSRTRLNATRLVTDGVTLLRAARGGLVRGRQLGLVAQPPTIQVVGLCHLGGVLDVLWGVRRS